MFSFLMLVSAKVMRTPKAWHKIMQSTRKKDVPGTPAARCVPMDVKKRHRALRQFCLPCSHARTVFSPALNMYFPVSNVITMVGSVSEETVETTEADQAIVLRCEVLELLRRACKARWFCRGGRKYLQCRRALVYIIPARLETDDEESQPGWEQDKSKTRTSCNNRRKHYSLTPNPLGRYDRFPVGVCPKIT